MTTYPFEARNSPSRNANGFSLKATVKLTMASTPLSR